MHFFNPINIYVYMYLNKSCGSRGTIYFEKIFETCAIQGAPGDDPLNKCSNCAVVQRKVNGKMLFAASVSCLTQTTQVWSMVVLLLALIHKWLVVGMDWFNVVSGGPIAMFVILSNKKIWIWFSCKISAIHMAEMPV